MIRLLALLCVVAVAGCATPKTKTTKTVRIETDPPGARIYLGLGSYPEASRKARQYVGQSPCTTEIETFRGDRFKIAGIPFYNMGKRATAVFYAEPASDATNLFPQSQTFYAPAAGQPGDKIPDAVFFDLHQNSEKKTR